jgi:hypothetical protein
MIYLTGIGTRDLSDSGKLAIQQVLKHSMENIS